MPERKFRMGGGPAGWAAQGRGAEMANSRADFRPMGSERPDTRSARRAWCRPAGRAASGIDDAGDVEQVPGTRIRPSASSCAPASVRLPLAFPATTLGAAGADARGLRGEPGGLAAEFADFAASELEKKRGVSRAHASGERAYTHGRRSRRASTSACPCPRGARWHCPCRAREAARRSAGKRG